MIALLIIVAIVLGANTADTIAMTRFGTQERQVEVYVLLGVIGVLLTMNGITVFA